MPAFTTQAAHRWRQPSTTSSRKRRAVDEVRRIRDEIRDPVLKLVAETAGKGPVAMVVCPLKAAGKPGGFEPSHAVPHLIQIKIPHFHRAGVDRLARAHQVLETEV